MVDDIPRSRLARVGAETALVRVAHHYGSRPEIVVLGGLVPDLLCSGSAFQHAGTTDVDVQVNLEIASGSVNARRLEVALRNAEFVPDVGRAWRWRSEGIGANVVIKFELLADLDDVRSEATVDFGGCEALGALNLRGTGFASGDVFVRRLTARIGGVRQDIEVNVTGLAGFLLAKASAAFARRLPKDWYDIAFVLLHNDEGGSAAAAALVAARFGDDLGGSVRTALDDLLDNFQTPGSQGPQAYAAQLTLDHPEVTGSEATADAIAAVTDFHAGLFG